MHYVPKSLLHLVFPGGHPVIGREPAFPTWYVALDVFLRLFAHAS